MNTTPSGNRPHTAAPSGGNAAENIEDRTLVDTADADALLADAARRQKIEADLRGMGMSPLEVQRLLNAQSRSFDPDVEDAPAPAARPAALPNVPLPPRPAPPSNPKNKAQASMQSMQSLAAELMAQKAAAQVQAVREVSLDLPPFRASSMQEVQQAEPLLRDASMLRRREKYRDAEVKAREALQLVPKDAAALELLGDILQGVARVDEAMAVYKRALEADPKRSSAERKYGELLVLQQNWNATDPEAMKGSSKLAVMLSLLLPGLGQFHNGEIGKGIFFLALDVVCTYLLAYSPFGFGGAHGHRSLSLGLILCISITVVIYIVALVDTVHAGKAGGAKRGGSGWEI